MVRSGGFQPPYCPCEGNHRLLEGLADVNAGNEVQVRFTLDLNGILTVAATERLTNLEEKLVIENAMERFRRSNREEAQERMRLLFGDQEPSPEDEEKVHEEAPPAESAAEDVPAEIQPLYRQAEHMLVRGQRVLPEASEEDAAELQQLMENLQTALAQRSEADIKQHYAALDDLVFYLQDG